MRDAVTLEELIEGLSKVSFTPTIFYTPSQFYSLAFAYFARVFPDVPVSYCLDAAYSLRHQFLDENEEFEKENL